MNSSVAATKKKRKHMTVYLDTLRVDTILAFDLYISNGSEIILYRAAALPFNEKTRCHLLENNVHKLYVASEDRDAYQQYLESNLSSIIADKSITESVKAGIVYDSAKFLVEDTFSSPTLERNVKRCQELVTSTVGFILTGQTALAKMLEVMSFDYSTYTHSVNVCTLSLALAQIVGIVNPSDLKALGTGALLHDIGKTKVGDPILNKVGPLTDSEMDIIRKHPQWGYDLIKETDLVDIESYIPILQHHERENGTGYPDGSPAKSIHRYGKITAIADVFDAMTTKRVYREAVDAYPALKEMFADEGAFDTELLTQFAKMLGPIELSNAD